MALSENEDVGAMEYNEENETVYKKLKELRRARGLTVASFAEKIKEDPQKVGRIERGDRSLTIGYLSKVSKALNTPIESFLDDGNQKPTNSDVLSRVVLAVEEHGKKVNITTAQKAELISKTYEMALKVPHEYQNHFLHSLFECLKITS